MIETLQKNRMQVYRKLGIWLALGCYGSGPAQGESIVLKNGTVIQGALIAMDDVEVTVETADMGKLIIRRRAVARISESPIPEHNLRQPTISDSTPPPSIHGLSSSPNPPSGSPMKALNTNDNSPINDSVGTRPTTTVSRPNTGRPSPGSLGEASNRNVAGKNFTGKSITVVSVPGHFFASAGLNWGQLTVGMYGTKRTIQSQVAEIDLLGYRTSSGKQIGLFGYLSRDHGPLKWGFVGVRYEAPLWVKTSGDKRHQGISVSGQLGVAVIQATYPVSASTGVAVHTTDQIIIDPKRDPNVSQGLLDSVQANEPFAGLNASTSRQGLGGGLAIRYFYDLNENLRLSAGLQALTAKWALGDPTEDPALDGKYGGMDGFMAGTGVTLVL